MRLWSLHPRFLDPQGLTALWREALLAREVLRGRTRGYRHHPQLERFRRCGRPRAAINQYLRDVHDEAVARGYAFDARKLARFVPVEPIAVTTGQLACEWSWLLDKLGRRSPEFFAALSKRRPKPAPLFRVVGGPVEPWERATRLSR